ncbi:MAG: hypothetical protein AAF721_33470, partial [Myxococcota bacterium]
RAARSAAESIGGRGGPSLGGLCTQSTMQLAFVGIGDSPAKVQIKAVRVLADKTAVPLATIESRVPMYWTGDGHYKPWDEVVPAGAELKASYRLAVPDWSALDTKLGKSSYVVPLVLDVDVEIDGVTTTLRSPPFNRERPHVIST